MFQSTDQIAFLENVLLQTFGKPALIRDFQFLYCGNFNLAARVQTDGGSFFVKWNEQPDTDMFACEARSLRLLQQAGALFIPDVHAYGQHDGRSFLVMDFVAASPQQPDYWADFGHKLAAQHRLTHPQHGLDFDNYIGALPQLNTFMNSGIAFFVENRLEAQAGRALYESKISHKTHQRLLQLFEKIPDYLPEEPAALLHGDLWSGNVMTGADGHVALVDPAAYYGLREAEIAFTGMFGGFDTAFYRAYFEVFPVQPGFQERVQLYNLYPLLVHVNLFGGGYLTAVERLLKKYVGG